MDAGTLLIAVVAGAIALFLWGGITQALLPWGIKSVQPVPPEKLDTLPDAMSRVTPPPGMYAVFNEQVAAFLAIRPGAYYNMGRYFAIEFITQLAVSAALVAILALTASLPMTERLLLVGLVVLLAELSIDLQYWNWWGFSTRYALGFAVNRIAGTLLTAFLLVNFILR